MLYTTLVGATIEVRNTGADALVVLSNGIKIGTIEPAMMAHYIERGYWKEGKTAGDATQTCDMCGAAATMTRPAYAFPWQEQPSASDPNETYCAKHYAAILASEERVTMKYARLAAA